MSDYSDIIDHPHYQSKTRPHMPMTSRAAQFAPFAALTGYDESVEEAKNQHIMSVEEITDHDPYDIC